MNDDDRDNDTFQHAIPRPSGPRKRESLPRISGQHHWENYLKMGRPKGKEKNASSNSSSPSTPQHSSPIKYFNSPKYTDEVKRRARTNSPSSPDLYPDLSDEWSNLEESFASTSTISENGSHSVTSSSNTSTSDRNSRKERSFNETYTPEKKTPSVNQKRLNQSQQSSILFKILSLVIVAVVLYCFVQKYFGSEIFDEDLKSKIIHLKRKFPSQDGDIWVGFRSGIADVHYKSHKPAIFLLLAIHSETTNCLAKSVAEVAQSALRGTGSIILTPNELGNNYGQVLELMENMMNRAKAVVISDLLSVQPEAILALHDICDQYHPLVAESVYVFTMRPESQDDWSHLKSLAETQIKKTFSKFINADTLDALITRIVNGAILAIREEKKIPCSE